MPRRTNAQNRAHKLARREAKAQARAARVRQAASARLICSTPLAWQIVDLGGVGTHPADGVVPTDDLSEEQWAQIMVVHPSVRERTSIVGANAWLCLRCGAVCGGPELYGELGSMMGFEPEDDGEYDRMRRILASHGVDPTQDGPSLVELAAAGDNEAIETLRLYAPELIPPGTSDADAAALAVRYLRERPR